MKIRNHVLMAAVTAMLAGSIVGPASVATAHTYTDWMGATWPSSDRTAEWKFSTNVPFGTNFRNRVKDAAFTWNAQGQSMTFAHQQGDVDPSTFYICGGTGSLVDYATISSSYLAQEQTCTSGGTIYSFKITFNPSFTWYSDAFLGPSNEYDTQGVATHEFGHATGRGELSTAPAGGDTSGHFKWTSSNNLCPTSDVGRHTMCDGTSAGSESFYNRSLETHDKDVFNAAY